MLAYPTGLHPKTCTRLQGRYTGAIYGDPRSLSLTLSTAFR
jgi:hypothetical protein